MTHLVDGVVFTWTIDEEVSECTHHARVELPDPDHPIAATLDLCTNARVEVYWTLAIDGQGDPITRRQQITSRHTIAAQVAAAVSQAAMKCREALADRREAADAQRAAEEARRDRAQQVTAALRRLAER